MIEILPPLQNQEERETAQGSGESRMRHFNSLSAFPGEDNIIYSGFGGLYPVAFLKVFLTLTAFLPARALYTSAR